mmetsp:Transcript_41849/g.64024  ORF Transcript_41849/g.64024 Transcript_41849/m.64024 type:complete len:152 (-) Transcript_41849:82-537(-)
MIYGLSATVHCIFTTTKHSVLHTLEGFLPTVLMLVYYAFAFGCTEVAWESPCLVIWSVGVFFTLSASRLIICTVTKARFTLFENIHLLLPMAFGLVTLPLNHILGLDETLIFLVVLVGGLAVYFYFVMNVIRQICESLNIYCLTIKDRKIN